MIKKVLLQYKSLKIIYSCFRLPWVSINFLVRSKFDADYKKYRIFIKTFDKKSDRVYILGSGHSICDIKNWIEIEKHDSIGFNFWLLHTHVPTIISIEIPDDINSYLELVKIRAKEYKNTVILFQEPRFFKKNVTTQLLNYFPHLIKTKSFIIAAPTKAMYRFIARLFFKYTSHIHFHEGTSSVDKLINLAVRLGYKEIVLCGVDLNNVDYFYFNKACLAKNLREFKINSSQKNHLIHMTNDPNYPRIGLTVGDSIMSLKPLLSDFGVSLFVENPNSSLSEILPVFKH